MSARDQILSAIIEKNNDAVLALLKEDPTLWDESFDGETMLHLIVHNNNPALIRALAQLPQWKNLVNKVTEPPAAKGIRPLMSAVWEDNIDCARAIIESNAQSGRTLYLDSQTAGGHTALTNAVDRGNLEMVKLILAAPFVNEILNMKKNVDSKSALMIAAEKGDEDIVKAILEMPETDFDAIADKKTAAEIATEKGFTEIAEMIETAKIAKIAKEKNIAPNKLPSYLSFLRDRRKAHTPTLFSEYLKELKAMDPSAKTTASQRAAVLARKTWSDTVSLTDQQNEQSEAQSKQEVLDRLIALGYRDNTEKVYETIIDFLQYNSAIVMSFDAGLLKKSKEQGGPTDFQALNVFELQTRDAAYVKDRDEAERGLFQSLEPERAKKPGIASILATEMARPRYAALMLLDRNHTIQNLGTVYGTSYLVLADHLKQSALNVPANPFHYHHSNKKDYKPSTYFHFETFLKQCSPEKLRALATRATTGQLSDEYKLLSAGEDGYITALLPGFNFLDKNCVQHIHINPAEYKLTPDELTFLLNEAKITTTNSESNPYPDLCKLFMKFCEGDNTYISDELVKKYPFLSALQIPKLTKIFPKANEAQIRENYSSFCLQLLLTRFPSLTRITDFYGLEPLHVAAKNGNHGGVAKLISIGKVDPNRIATGGKDAIDFALENEDIGVVSAILCATAAKGSAAMLKQLLAKIKKLNNPLANACLNETSKNGETPLFIAASRGDKEKLNAILAFPDVDLLLARPTDGKTPEQIARDNGHDEIADILKSRTAPEYKLIAVLKTNHLDNVKKFIREGSIDIKNTILPDGNSVLTFAILNCSVEIVREIASIPGMNLNHRKENGETALSFAIKNNDLEKVKLLYEMPGISFLTISEISKIAKKGPVRKYLFAKTTLEEKTDAKNSYYKKAMDKLKEFAAKALKDDTLDIEPEGVSYRKIKALNIEIQQIQKVKNDVKFNAAITELKALALNSFTPKVSFVSQYQLLAKKHNEFIQQQEAKLYSLKNAEEVLHTNFEGIEKSSVERLKQFAARTIAGEDIDMFKEYHGGFSILHYIHRELEKTPPSKDSKLNLKLERVKHLVAKALQPEQSFFKEYWALKKEYEDYKSLSARASKIDAQINRITKELDYWEITANDYPFGKQFILSHIEKIRDEAKKIEDDDSIKLEDAELKLDALYAACDEDKISEYIAELNELAPPNCTQLGAVVEDLVLSRYSRRFDHDWHVIKQQCEQLLSMFKWAETCEKALNKWAKTWKRTLQPNQMKLLEKLKIESQNAYLSVNKDNFQQNYEQLQQTYLQIKKLDSLAKSVADYFNEKQDAPSTPDSKEESVADYLLGKINLAYAEADLKKASQSILDEFDNIQSLDKLRVSTPIKNLMGICVDATNPSRMAAAITLRDKILDLYQQTDKADFYINFEMAKHEIQEFSSLNSYADHLLQIEKNYKATKTARTKSVESIKEAIVKAYGAYGPLDAKECKEQLAREVDQIQAGVKKDHQTTSRSRFLGRFQPESKLVEQISLAQKTSNLKFLSGHQPKGKHVAETQHVKGKSHKQKK